MLVVSGVNSGSYSCHVPLFIKQNRYCCLYNSPKSGDDLSRYIAHFFVMMFIILLCFFLLLLNENPNENPNE